MKQLFSPLRFFFLLIVLNFIPSSLLFAQKSDGWKIDYKRAPLLPGEILNFELTVFGVKVGEQSNNIVGYETINGEKTIRIFSRTWSSPLIQHVYTLDDKFHVWLRISDYMPVKAKWDLIEGKSKSEFEITFDYKKKEAVVYRPKKDTYKTIELLDNEVELLSMIYTLRRLDYSDVKKLMVTLLDPPKPKHTYYPVIVEKKGNKQTVTVIEKGQKRTKKWDVIELTEDTRNGLIIHLIPELNYVPSRIIIPAINVSDWGVIRVDGKLKTLHLPSGGD